MSVNDPLLEFEDRKFIEHSQLVQNLANEWRQPISVLSAQLLYLQTMQQLGSEVQVAKELDKILPRLHEAIKKMDKTMHLFENFYDQKDKEYFYPYTEIENITAMFNQQLILKDIALEIDCAKSLQLFCCKTTFLNVLMILFKNAVEALENKTDEAKIIIGVKYEYKKIILSVADNGEGIKEVDQSKLFENGFTTKEQSAGMGLCVAKALVHERLQGDISYQQKDAFKFFSIIV